MNKKYYWLKIDASFFDDIRIKKLRQLAGGDTFTCIYMKLMLLSLKHEGKLILEHCDDFAEELSLKIDEKIENVKLTLLYCENEKLIEILDENEINLPQVISSIGSESESAERVRRYREKKKLNNKVKSIESATTNNATKVLEMYNTICTHLSTCRKLTNDRKAKINKRLKEFSIDDIEKAFQIANKSDFLTGKSTSFTGNIDWMFRNQTNIQRILEGEFSKNNFTQKKKIESNFEQRNYSDDDYEIFYK